MLSQQPSPLSTGNILVPAQQDVDIFSSAFQHSDLLDMFQQSSSSHNSTDQLLLTQTGPQHSVVPVADALSNLLPGTSLMTILDKAGVTSTAIKAATYCKDISTNKGDSLLLMVKNFYAMS